MSKRRYLAFFLLSLTPAWVLAASAVVVTQLSDIQQPDGDASGLIVSQNGATVCFVADAQVDEARELYCGAAATPQKATLISSGLLPMGTGAVSVTLSSDGSMVYYLAPELSGSKVELFRAPTDGSGPRTRMNAPLAVANGNVSKYKLLEVQQRLLYVADADVDNAVELYVVDLALPGQANKLSGPIVAGGTGVKQFRFDETTGRVYYTSEQQELDKIELYANALAGGALIKLSAPIAAGDFVGSIGLVPGGAHVYYNLIPSSGPINLWVSPATVSGSAWQVNQTLQAGGQATAAATSADGSRIVYVADVSVDSRFGLYSRALDGSDPQPIQLDDAIVQFPPMSLNTLPRIAYTDAHTLIYVDAYNGDGIGKLQTQSDGGVGAPLILSGALDVLDFKLITSRGEALAIYNNGANNLASIKLDASAVTPLTSFSTNTGVFLLYPFGQTGDQWLFMADPTNNTKFKLFLLDLNTQTYEQKSSTASTFQEVQRVFVDPRTNWAYFVESFYNSTIFYSSWVLRSLMPDGSLGPDFASLGGIVTFARDFKQVLHDPTTPNRVFYTVDAATDEQFEAFQADFDPAVFADGFEN